MRAAPEFEKDRTQLLPGQMIDTLSDRLNSLPSDLLEDSELRLRDGCVSWRRTWRTEGRPGSARDGAADSTTIDDLDPALREGRRYRLLAYGRCPWRTTAPRSRSGRNASKRPKAPRICRARCRPYVQSSIANGRILARRWHAMVWRNKCVAAPAGCCLLRRRIHLEALPRREVGSRFLGLFMCVMQQEWSGSVRHGACIA